MIQNESRIFYRIPTDMIAQIDVTGDDGGDLPIYGVMTNLSEGGAFLETISRLDIGTELTLTFDLPDGGGTFKMQATACRHSDIEPQGIGLKFARLDAENQLMLSRLVDEQRTRESSRGEPPRDIKYFVGEEGGIMKRVVGDDGSETIYHRDSRGEFLPVDSDHDQAVIAAKLLLLIESGDVDAIEKMGFKVQRQKGRKD